MQMESIVIYGCMTIFALGLLVVSIFSYRKYRNNKLIFVSLSFLMFFIKGVLLSIGMFNQQIQDLMQSPYNGIFDFVILTLLLLATLKR